MKNSDPNRSFVDDIKESAGSMYYRCSIRTPTTCLPNDIFVPQMYDTHQTNTVKLSTLDSQICASVSCSATSAVPSANTYNKQMAGRRTPTSSPMYVPGTSEVFANGGDNSEKMGVR